MKMKKRKKPKENEKTKKTEWKRKKPKKPIVIFLPVFCFVWPKMAKRDEVEQKILA